MTPTQIPNMTELVNQFPKLNAVPMANSVDKFAYLRLYVDATCEELQQLYQEHVASHNEKLGLGYDCENNKYVFSNSYPNSGFDLFVPYKTELPSLAASDGAVTMAKLKVKAEMFTVSNTSPAQRTSCGYYLMPRSSISKTPLVQANHVGLIDMGYRGEIMAALRNVSSSTYTIEANTRLFQLCHPETLPIWVEIVANETELSSTERGAGGFGSTGVIGAI